MTCWQSTCIIFLIFSIYITVNFTVFCIICFFFFFKYNLKKLINNPRYFCNTIFFTLLPFLFLTDAFVILKIYLIFWNRDLSERSEAYRVVWILTLMTVDWFGPLAHTCYISDGVVVWRLVKSWKKAWNINILRKLRLLGSGYLGPLAHMCYISIFIDIWKYDAVAWR